MKKILFAFAAVFLSFFLLTGCADSRRKPPLGGPRSAVSDDMPENQPENLPETLPETLPGNLPESPASPVLSEASPQTLILTNDPSSLRLDLTDDSVTLSGAPQIEGVAYLMLDFPGTDTDPITGACTEGTVLLTAALPETADLLTVNIFGGTKEYGRYESLLLDFVRIEKQNGSWRFAPSPVLAENERLFALQKNPEDFLSSEERIQSDNEEIRQTALTLTAECVTDREKARVLHDWVAENVYYDMDAYASGNYENLDAVNVLHLKKGVCEGYANLYAALLRSIGIPCRKQGGLALGISTARVWDETSLAQTTPNHAWNEVYIDGRWLLVDTTWDSTNIYQNGQYLPGSTIGHLYFDSTMAFFSLSHRMMEN